MTQIKELEMQIAQTRVINGFDIDNPPWQKEETVGGNFACIQVKLILFSSPISHLVVF
jgi:hypothetical protein